jgi:hypothetical protein
MIDVFRSVIVVVDGSIGRDGCDKPLRLEYSRNVAALSRSMRNALLNCVLHQAVLPVPRGPSKKKCFSE